MFPGRKSSKHRVVRVGEAKVEVKKRVDLDRTGTMEGHVKYVKLRPGSKVKVQPTAFYGMEVVQKRPERCWLPPRGSCPGCPMVRAEIRGFVEVARSRNDQESRRRRR